MDFGSLLVFSPQNSALSSTVVNSFALSPEEMKKDIHKRSKIASAACVFFAENYLKILDFWIFKCFLFFCKENF